MQIEVVDLSPITLDRVDHDGRLFVLCSSLELIPELDESQQFLEVRDKTLDLLVYARNREQLVDELAKHLAVLWDEYAKEEPAHLSEAARRLRERVLSVLEEQPRA